MITKYKKANLLTLILVIIIMSVSGCFNYYNQKKKLILGIDDYLLLKLIRNIDKKYKKTNIFDVNKLNNNNPFKRILNKNNYVNDLVLKIKNEKFIKYNNNYYEINDKYKRYIEDEWDDIGLKALYSDLIGYNENDFNLLISLINNKGNYTDTHVLLALLILKENKSYNLEIINKKIEQLVKALLEAAENDKTFSDLFAERIVFLYWAGYGNLVKKEWIDIIKKAQNKDLGWGIDQSHPHPTGLSILSILYFNQKKNKQKFYY